jgi:hypothetical protein
MFKSSTTAFAQREAVKLPRWLCDDVKAFAASCGELVVLGCRRIWNLGIFGVPDCLLAGQTLLCLYVCGPKGFCQH